MLGDPTSNGMPELELNDKQTGAVRYFEHGYPHWQVRWHYHDEYELHLIVATSGKVFIGDYVGSFQPGCLFLIGPRVPHNWVSNVPEDSCYELRDRVIHFDHDTVTNAAALLPELRMLLPLLARAKHGIEFRHHTDTAEKYMLSIKESDGAARLAYFFELLDILARSPNQQLLSASQIDLPTNEDLHKKIDRVVNYVMEHYRETISLAQVAVIFGMSESHFSRFFRKATGSCFNELVNRIRVAKACDLLSRTDMAITLICYEVGFKNVANFNRRFAQHKQMTPSQYRQQARQRYYNPERLTKRCHYQVTTL